MRARVWTFLLPHLASSSFFSFILQRGWTPLHFACAQGDAKVVALLVKAKASKEIGDFDGNTVRRVLFLTLERFFITSLILFWISFDITLCLVVSPIINTFWTTLFGLTHT